MLNKYLVNYIEKNIFIKYEKFYAHGRLHINNVIKNMLMLADYYNLDRIWHMLLQFIMILV